MSACLSGARDWYAGSCVRQCVVSVEKKNGWFVGGYIC